jgi:hypothetical protein
MKTEICTKFDPYFRNMCHNEVVMSWTAKLQNGLTVYGDYERPGYMKCWDRMKTYCKENKVVPTEVKLYMLGAQEFVFFEDPDGLDGISICRGAAREQSLSGDFQDFQFLSVSLLRESCDYIDVKKFVWPFNEFEEGQSVREISQKNVEQMIFKHDSQKAKHPEIQKYLDGATV